MIEATAIVGGTILTPLRTINQGTVLVRGERVEAVGPREEIPIPEGAELIPADGKLVIPGFIDTHIHAWRGATPQTAEGARAIAKGIAEHGTTAFLPTLGGEPDFERLLGHVRETRQAMRMGTDGAEILGIHMEGPYLSDEPIARGSQRTEAMRRPSLSEFHRLVEAAEGAIRKMSIAPELDGALDLIREMSRLGIVASAAHSVASYEQTIAAVKAGLRCATHAFNGMIPMHHREPGLVGAMLTCDEITAELIADGVHVLPPAMQVLLRCKGTDRVHLVTDNSEMAGIPDGVYDQPDGRRIIKEGAKAWVVGRTLAGSVLPMNGHVRNIVALAGYPLSEAVKMATVVAAQLHGVGDRKGMLEAGKDADLVIIDEAVNVYLTMVRGRQVFRASGLSLPTAGG